MSSNDSASSDRFNRVEMEVIFVTARLSLRDLRRHAISDLVCAVIRAVCDAVFVIAAVPFWRDGSIPTVLDSVGGRWPWLAAGTVAGGFVLDEVPGALYQLNDACEDVLMAFPELTPAPVRQWLGFDVEQDATDGTRR